MIFHEDIKTLDALNYTQVQNAKIEKIRIQDENLGFSKQQDAVYQTEFINLCNANDNYVIDLFTFCKTKKPSVI